MWTTAIESSFPLPRAHFQEIPYIANMLSGDKYLSKSLHYVTPFAASLLPTKQWFSNLSVYGLHWSLENADSWPFSRDSDSVNTIRNPGILIFTKPPKKFKWLKDHMLRNTGRQNTVPAPHRGNVTFSLLLSQLIRCSRMMRSSAVPRTAQLLALRPLHLLPLHLKCPFPPPTGWTLLRPA